MPACFVVAVRENIVVADCRGRITAPDGFPELPAVNLRGMTVRMHDSAGEIFPRHHDVFFIRCGMIALEIESEKHRRRHFGVFRDVKQHYKGMALSIVHGKVKTDLFPDCGAVKSVFPDGKGFKPHPVRARRNLPVDFFLIQGKHFRTPAVHPFISSCNTSSVLSIQRGWQGAGGNPGLIVIDIFHDFLTGPWHFSLLILVLYCLRWL